MIKRIINKIKYSRLKPEEVFLYKLINSSEKINQNGRIKFVNDLNYIFEYEIEKKLYGVVMIMS